MTLVHASVCVSVNQEVRMADQECLRCTYLPTEHGEQVKGSVRGVRYCVERVIECVE